MKTPNFGKEFLWNDCKKHYRSLFYKNMSTCLWLLMEIAKGKGKYFWVKLSVGTSITKTKCVNKVWKILPVAVIIIVVVTSQGCQAPQADRIREEYLCAGIHPHLKANKTEWLKKDQEGITFMHILTADLQRWLHRVIMAGQPFISHNLQKKSMLWVKFSSPSQWYKQGVTWLVFTGST